MEQEINNDDELIPSKGLYHLMKEHHKVVPYTEPLTVEKLAEIWENLRKQDEERRKRMDESHTPIEEITLEEIEDIINSYGGDDKVPCGLQVKVRISGQYYSWPILAIRDLMKAIKKEAQTYVKANTTEKGRNTQEEGNNQESSNT